MRIQFTEVKSENFTPIQALSLTSAPRSTDIQKVSALLSKERDGSPASSPLANGTPPLRGSLGPNVGGCSVSGSSRITRKPSGGGRDDILLERRDVAREP